MNLTKQIKVNARKVKVAQVHVTPKTIFFDCVPFNELEKWLKIIHEVQKK